MVAKYEFDADDARLSAYALGELEESERAEVEALLANNAEARAFVEGLRDTMAQVERALAEQDPATLTDAQRVAVLAGVDAAPRLDALPDPRAVSATAKRPMPWASRVRVALAAAIVVATVGGTLYWTQSSERSRPAVEHGELAMRAKNDAAWKDRSRRSSDSPESLRGLGYLGGGSEAQKAPPPAANELHALTSLGYADASAQPVASVNPTAAPFLLGKGSSAEQFRYHTWRDTSRMRELGYIGPDVGLQFEALERPNSEQYDSIVENVFRRTLDEAMSTFSIDVDTASYANMRRFLRSGRLPPADAVRVEELINYFSYDYPQPTGAAPFSVTTDVLACPWAPTHRLVRIGLKGREVHRNERKDSHLVFLIDVSGSMSSEDKLPLVQRSLRMLTEQLDVRDRVSIVVYAGNEGLVLEPTSGRERGEILEAIDRLNSGGSTNGGAGINLAYKIAREHRIEGGVNRVILCTDGDFNVGVTNREDLVKLIEEQRKSGVFLSVLGFGTGNLKDSQMEQLADKGNGAYAYIDSLTEARKVLVEQMSGTLETIAKDVKIQLEFNPAQVQAWRQIGYENRVLAHQDFNDDTKDAGEIGAGHTVTALYEIVPVGVALDTPGVDDSRYQKTADTSPKTVTAEFADELMFVKLRYKAPDADVSQLITKPVSADAHAWNDSPADARFASAVAAFGMKLRGSAHVANLSYAQIGSLAADALGRDEHGWRVEFLDLVRKADELAK